MEMTLHQRRHTDAYRQAEAIFIAHYYGNANQNDYEMVFHISKSDLYPKEEKQQCRLRLGKAVLVYRGQECTLVYGDSMGLSPNVHKHIYHMIKGHLWLQPEGAGGRHIKWSKSEEGGNTG